MKAIVLIMIKIRKATQVLNIFLEPKLIQHWKDWKEQDVQFLTLKILVGQLLMIFEEKMNLWINLKFGTGLTN